MKNTKNRLLLAVLLLVTLGTLGTAFGQVTDSTAPAVSAESASATVPRLMQFNGVAKDTVGKPLTGTVGVTFLLYRDEQGGAPLWMETQNVQADAKGHYSVQLGAATPDGLPTDAFTSGEARWLGVQIADQTEQPRVLLLAVPYALKAADASTIGGLPPSAFVRTNPDVALPSGSKSSGTSSSSEASTMASKNPLEAQTLLGVKTLSPGATLGFVPLWTGSKSPTTQIGSSALFQSGNNIGIGTTSPGGTLDVKGTTLLEGTLDLPQTTGVTVGVIDVGGLPFIHACCSSKAQDTFVGTNAGNLTTTGSANTAIGYEALVQDTSGGANTAVGWEALIANTTGFNNTAVGDIALPRNNTGVNNTAVGSDAAGNNTTGSYNTAVGELALGFNNTGNLNTAVGFQAGPAQGLTNLTNATAIGAGAQVDASNSLVLGVNTETGTTDTNVGIGTSSPKSILDIKGNNTFEPLLVESPNTFGTWIQLANTSSGARTWFMISTASANGEGAGNLAFNNSNFNGSGTVIIHSNLHVDGNLSKGSGSFQIDHPLDPANKYLYHSFVESPDMMNIYNGNVTTNKQGLAVISLPDYFEALNGDFRYQLTPIGQFAQAIVAKEISHGRFTIRTSRPGVKVSWQVTGIRHDAYADAHRIQVEEEKPLQERGRYLHPELFGAPQEKSVGYSAPPPPTMAVPTPVASTVSTVISDAN